MVFCKSWSFSKRSFLYLIKIKKINNKSRQTCELYNFLKKSLENFFFLFINLSVDEIKLVAKNTDIKDYKNKSKEDLIKILSESKPKRKINKKKLEEIIKNFNELKHKFSQKEIDKWRKTFHNIRNYRYLSAAEIEEAKKILLN